MALDIQPTPSSSASSVPAMGDQGPVVQQAMAALFQERGHVASALSNDYQLPAVAPLSSSQQQIVAQATAACAEELLFFGRQNSTMKAIGATILLTLLALCDAILYVFAFDSVLSILPNLKENFQKIWSEGERIDDLRYWERKELIKFLQTPKSLPSEKHRRLLIDIATNYPSLKAQLPTLPPSQRKFLEACFASSIPLFQIPKAIYCTDPAEFAAHPNYEAGNLKGNLEKISNQHERGQLKAEMEKYGSLDTEMWDLPFRQQAVSLPISFAKETTRRLTSVTICPKEGPSVMVISNNVIDHLSEQERPNVLPEDILREVQRDALNLLMARLYAFSSMQEVASVDPNVLTSLFQKGAVANFTMPCCYGLTFSLLNAKTNFRSKALSTEIHDVSHDEIRVVYDGSLDITNGARQDAPSIGSINYRMTLVWKREGDQWIDVSYATDPKDGRQISFQDSPVFFQSVED